jgi:hypothetical protein
MGEIEFPPFNMLPMANFNNLSPETKEFINKYLKQSIIPSRRNPKVIITRWNEICEDFENPNLSKGSVDYYIRSHFPASSKSLYNKFLGTAYWIIISDEVRRRAGNKCLWDNSHDNEILDVHHGSYIYHGMEIQNIHLLVCLCHNCHTAYHDKKTVEPQEANIKEVMISVAPEVKKPRVPFKSPTNLDELSWMELLKLVKAKKSGKN